MSAPNRRSPTNAPVPKVVAAGVGGAITFLIVVFAKQAGLDWVTEEVAAAAVAVVAVVAGYFKKP